MVEYEHWASGGIGRRARLKIWSPKGGEGSIPSPPTKRAKSSFLLNSYYKISNLSVC